MHLRDGAVEGNAQADPAFRRSKQLNSQILFKSRQLLPWLGRIGNTTP